MDLIETLTNRQSIRAFKPEPVPKDRLEKILAAARWTPSYTNTQPWEAVVVAGKKRDELVRILSDLAETGAPTNPDIERPKEWPDELTRRRDDHMTKRQRTLGIDPADKENQKTFRLSNFRFYGAPCVIFLTQDRSLTPYSIFDLGMFAQSVMLAAHNFGLGTCAQASIVSYPDAIRKFLGIAESKRIVLGIAIGYPDLAAAANSYRSERVGGEEFTRWFGFE